MTEPVADAGHRLPCGYSVADLLELLADPDREETAEHVRTCPYCGERLRVLRGQWEPVRRAAAAPVRPPAGLVERTLATVREARRDHGGDPVELSQDGGTLRVSAAATLSLTRAACTDLVADRRGVRLAACRGGAYGVTVDLVVTYPLPALEVAEAVRTGLTGRLRDYLGAGTPRVSVHIADVDLPN